MLRVCCEQLVAVGLAVVQWTPAALQRLPGAVQWALQWAVQWALQTWQPTGWRTVQAIHPQSRPWALQWALLVLKLLVLQLLVLQLLLQLLARQQLLDYHLDNCRAMRPCRALLLSLLLVVLLLGVLLLLLLLLLLGQQLPNSRW